MWYFVFLHWLLFCCCSPQVRPLASSGKLNDALKERVDSVFFLYIGPTDGGQRVFVGHYIFCVLPLFYFQRQCITFNLRCLLVILLIRIVDQSVQFKGFCMVLSFSLCIIIMSFLFHLISYELSRDLTLDSMWIELKILLRFLWSCLSFPFRRNFLV